VPDGFIDYLVGMILAGGTNDSETITWRIRPMQIIDLEHVEVLDTETCAKVGGGYWRGIDTYSFRGLTSPIGETIDPEHSMTLDLQDPLKIEPEHS
jgi:hypothetical protein